MTRFFIVLLLAISVTENFAQSGKVYLKRASEIQHEIWNDTSAAFHVSQIPTEMKNESAVIIASSFEVVSTSKYTFKFSGSARRVNSQITTHMRIRINDKVAIDKFSTLEYERNRNYTHVYMMDVYYDISNTYLGAKIIKPDGTETVINIRADDLAEKKGKDKQGRLFISNLKEGDILDYYIRIEEVQDAGNLMLGPFTIEMGDEFYPILYSSTKFLLDQRFGVKYTSANGAPMLKESRDTNNNIVLELSQTNLPRFHDTLWISLLRQYPFINLQCILLSGKQTYHGFNQGVVKNGILYYDVVEELKTYMNSNFLPVGFGMADYQPLTLTREHFGGSEKLKHVPQDSIVRYLYNAWFYHVFWSNINSPEDMLRIKTRRALKLNGAMEMSKMLSSIGIENIIYLVCSRKATSIENSMNISDFDALVKVKTEGGLNYWLAFDDIFNQFNEIPMRFQGEDAIIMKTTKEKKPTIYVAGRDKVPKTNPGENISIETLRINFDSTNIRLLRMDMACRQTGAMRYDNEKQLLPVEDMDEGISASLSQKKIVDKLHDERKERKANEYSEVFEKERANEKTYFINEINHRFGSTPSDLYAYEIHEPALFSSEPSFEFSSVFSLGNLVKKDNENYVLELGWLLNADKNAPDFDRMRSVDIYMPCSRTLKWNITINIPNGYNVKGVAELSKSLRNETGSLIVNASRNGGIVEIQVSEIFQDNFEKLSSWPKLLALLDAFQNLSSQRILLERINESSH